MTTQIHFKIRDQESPFQEKGYSRCQGYINAFSHQIDELLKKWIRIYGMLSIATLGFLGSFLISCAVSTHYVVAIVSGLFLASCIALFSFNLYCRETFFATCLKLEGTLMQFFEIDTTVLLQEIPEEYIRAGFIIKKRWLFLIPPFRSRLGKVVGAPITSLINQWLWIPYSLLAEIFFDAAKRCYIHLLKKSPKNLELHAGLANTYVTLATHMKEAISMKDQLLLYGRLIPKSFFHRMFSKQEYFSLRAIQELSILRSFQPDELWVLDQLAISYRELGMTAQEMEVYQAILSRHGDDTNALFRLGVLSFQKGDNARGLELYDELLRLQPILAHELIASFGAYDLQQEP